MNEVTVGLQQEISSRYW